MTGIDPRTKKLARLFNPRRHKWDRHFRWQGPYLVGRSPVGRVTIAVLAMNDPDAVRAREELLAEGVFPPTSNSTGKRRMPGSFFDTNVLVYLASGDAVKADQAENAIAGGGSISAQ